MHIENILTDEARGFLDALHGQFNARRMDLLQQRQVVQTALDQGKKPSFRSDTKDIRENPEWKVAETPVDLRKRWVEITGPVERKMMINALNSGADVFMADFEDALSPTWKNIIQGQINLMEAVRKTLNFIDPDQKAYRLNEKTATLMVRPRGWHLEEQHYDAGGECISASLFDFGLYLFHNGKALLERGSGPYFYLPKLENAQEARLWNDVFLFSERYLGLVQGSIKATVLIETILAAFEMEEILYELKEYIVGLNAGRWDYIFSIIKKFSNDPHFLFPDREQITMTVPFMLAYTELLVQTCHKRNAYALGGMAAFVPSRKDPIVNAKSLEKVEADKLREAEQGFDGTWVAHPDLVPVAYSVFEKKLKGRAHQKKIKRVQASTQASRLIDWSIPNGTITLGGIKSNISVSLQYLESWLFGVGAVAINQLMEDAATAEIARGELWQWVHHRGKINEDHQCIDLDLIKELMDQELNRCKAAESRKGRKWDAAYALLNGLIERVVFTEFFTLEAYNYLPSES